MVAPYSFPAEPCFKLALPGSAFGCLKNRFVFSDHRRRHAQSPPRRFLRHNLVSRRGLSSRRSKKTKGAALGYLLRFDPHSNILTHHPGIFCTPAQATRIPDKEKTH
jgi:hypothetical protein